MINLEGVVSVNWQDVPATEIFPGIRKRILMRTKSGFMAQNLKIDAGAKFTQLDVHEPGPEEIFVV